MGRMIPAAPMVFALPALGLISFDGAPPALTIWQVLLIQVAMVSFLILSGSMYWLAARISRTGGLHLHKFKYGSSGRYYARTCVRCGRQFAIVDCSGDPSPPWVEITPSRTQTTQ